jgi:hypothetical protein
MSEVGANYSLRNLLYYKDSTARESRINKVNGNSPTRIFGNFSPFINDNYRGNTLKSSSLTGWNIISSKEEEMKTSSFSTIMNNTPGTIFRISLLNLLMSTNQQIYPYLEYQFSFPDDYIADRFYRIDATGKYGKYEVRLLVQKPTIKESVLGSFTVIF